MLIVSKQLKVHLEPEECAAENMRRDSALLNGMKSGDHPVLRFYNWKPSAISLGYMQDPARLIDFEKCRSHGIDIVRRPTGGRAILHCDEITYAMIAPLDDARFGTHLYETHSIIGECLRAGLQELGVMGSLSRPRRDPLRGDLRQPCFASAGRAELLVAGKKLIGSAQRRTRAAFLQHGSLLTGNGHLRLVDYLLQFKNDAQARDRARESLRRGTTDLKSLTGERPEFHSAASALVHGFERTLQLRSPLHDEIDSLSTPPS